MSKKHQISPNNERLPVRLEAVAHSELSEPRPEKPIRRPRLSEEIVRRLERSIREGDYKVGVQLPSERELMRRYGVGRSAVREALYALRKSGLIELKGGSRPRVTEPSARVVLTELSSAARFFLDQPSGVRDLQGLRMLFEVALVRDAAVNSTKQDLHRMKQALNANRHALPDREAFIRTDIAFHFRLAARTGNPVITAIHDAMVEWLDEQREVALLKAGVEPISYAQHAEIYDAVERKDADRAEAAMREHLELVAENYWASRRG